MELKSRLDIGKTYKFTEVNYEKHGLSRPKQHEPQFGKFYCVPMLGKVECVKFADTKVSYKISYHVECVYPKGVVGVMDSWVDSWRIKEAIPV